MIHHRLLCRLAEAVVVIGADETSQLEPMSLNHQEDSQDNGVETYRPTVLSTLTENRAIYLNTSDVHCSNIYPSPHCSMLKSPKLKYSGHTERCHLHTEDSNTNAHVFSKTVNLKPRIRANLKHLLERYKSQDEPESLTHENINEEETIIKRTLAERKMSLRVKSIVNHSNTIQEPSVGTDTIKGIPMLCFPKGLTVLTTKPSESFSSTIFIPLTDFKGGRLFASGIIFYRQFHKIRTTNESSVIYLQDVKDATNNITDGLNFVYVPCAIIVISKYPYFATLKDTLSALLAEIKSPSTNFKFCVETFAITVTNTPVIEYASNIILEFELFRKHFKIMPRLPFLETVVDFDITLIFRYFSVDNIIQLAVSLLLQRRLILVSENPIIATISCQILLSLIVPFKWRFTYAPYLPENLLELFEAPGSYLYGCHSKHLQLILETENVIVGNLDSGEVILNKSDPLPLPPSFAIQRLKSSLQIKTTFETWLLSQVEPQTMADFRLLRSIYHYQNSKEVLFNFFVFMVDIFQDVTNFMKTGDNYHFALPAFLRNQKESKEFYEAVTKADPFDSFLRDRFCMKNDAWTLMVNKSRPTSIGVSSRPYRSSTSDETLNRKRSIYDPCFSSNGITDLIETPDDDTFDFETCSVMKITPFIENNFENFFLRTIQQIESILRDINLSLRSKCAYQRMLADLQQAVGNKEKALQIFFDLINLDANIVNKSEIIILIDGLTELERKQISHKDFFKSLVNLIHYDAHHITEEDLPHRITKKIVLPRHPLQMDDFFRITEEAEISTNIHVQERLFCALTLDDKSALHYRFVNPVIFNTYYRCWEEAYQATDFSILDATDFNETEIVLKMSPEVSIKPLGYGRLVLTQERLMVILAGSTNAKHLVKFENILSVEEMETWIRTFGKNTAMLKIRMSNLPSHYISLKSESPVWQILISELITAHRLCNKTKDISWINQAIDQCLILDTIFACVASFNLGDEPNGLYFNQHQKEIIKQLTFNGLSTCTVNPMNLSADTKRILKYKFQPDSRHSGQESIEAFTCVGTQLWCTYTGQRCAKLLIFDIKSPEASSKKAKHEIGSNHYLLGEVNAMLNKKLMCLVYIEKSGTVWAGGQDNIIYVIDATKKHVVQQLQGHGDIVLSLVSSEDENFVISGSSLGDIYVWNTSSYKLEHKWKYQEGVLQLLFHDNGIYCCSRKEILVYSINGVLLDSFVLDSKSPTNTITRSNSRRTQYQGEGFECICIHKNYLYVAYSKSSTIGVYSITKEEVSENNTTSLKLTHIDDILFNVCCTTYMTLCEQCRASKIPCLQCRENNKCRGLSRLVAVGDQIWACCKNGNIFIFDLAQGNLLYQLEGHSCAILSICAFQQYPFVFTGGRAPDSKIAVWNVLATSPNNAVVHEAISNTSSARNSWSTK